MPKHALRDSVAKKIRKTRIQLNLTQEGAAESTQFHYKYYQKIESGAVNLTLDSIEKLCRAFKIPVSRLFV